MKKLIFTAVMAVLVLVLAACTTTGTTTVDTTDTTTTTTVDTTTVDTTTTTTDTTTTTTTTTVDTTVDSAAQSFIETALQFIEAYPSEGKEQLNRSIDLIHLSSSLRATVFKEVNSALLPKFSEKNIGYGNTEIYSVKCWIHNFQLGGDAGCVSLNGEDATGNLSHDPTLLAASVLTPDYPDNVSLAEARISAYVLLQMDIDDVIENCIVKSANGEFDYDLTLQNENFKEAAKEILQALLE